MKVWTCQFASTLTDPVFIASKLFGMIVTEPPKKPSMILALWLLLGQQLPKQKSIALLAVSV
jgi:hypothetical protein